MKRSKIFIGVFLLIILILSFAVPVSADTASTVKLMVNNSIVASTASSFQDNGTVMSTAKELMEALGGTFNYNETTMTGMLRKGDTELDFRLDDSIAKLNGKNVAAGAPMKITNGRFFVPARFVSEQFGANTYMNTSKNTLMIFLPVDGKITYQVVSGDTLWIISQLFGTTISNIKDLNGLTSDMLYVGQKLVIKKNMQPVSIAIPAKTTGGATIYTGPGFGNSVLGYLASGASISVTGKNGDWFKVTTPKGNGYIYYTIVGITQDVSDTAPNSSFFDSQIPIDTSKDSVTYKSYTVVKGDTLWSVSNANGIPEYELAAANNLPTSAYLSIGQIISIPVHNVPVKAVNGAGSGEILDWFKEAQYVFPVGKTGKFTDIETGKSFYAKRTMGANHSDTEVLTAADADTMKAIFGGSWTWNRRPFILEVGGRRLAVSVAGMPHAGIDGVPYLQNVDNRSDNWGYGPNYDSISGNGMNGHFDVYFLNCLRHVDNKIDPAHQVKVLIAGGLK